jgi:hypothetical protein
MAVWMTAQAGQDGLIRHIKGRQFVGRVQRRFRPRCGTLIPGGQVKSGH